MEDAFDRELLEIAMRRAEKRVKPANWRAFHLTAIDQRSGADVAGELGMPVARVFIAKHRVQRMIEEEMAQAQQGTELSPSSGSSRSYRSILRGSDDRPRE